MQIKLQNGPTTMEANKDVVVVVVDADADAEPAEAEETETETVMNAENLATWQKTVGRKQRIKTSDQQVGERGDQKKKSLK